MFEDDGLSNVKHLCLNECFIGDAGVRSLTQSAHLPDLHTLELFRCDIGDDGARALGQSDSLSHLEKLNLGGNNISVAGLQALAQSTSFKADMIIESNRFNGTFSVLQERMRTLGAHVNMDRSGRIRNIYDG